MKSYIPYSLLLAAASCGLAFGAATAYTTPVGYSSQPLLQGYNFAGLTLQTPSLASGTFEDIQADALTDNDVTYAPVAGRTYVLEITSGTLTGVIAEIPANWILGSVINTTTNFATLGLQTTDTYNLRLAPTLEEIFTVIPLASGGTLAASFGAANADIVWISTGTGAFEKYFLRSGTPATFQRILTSTTFEPAPNVPLIYADGLLIQKKQTTAATLVVSGEVKTVGTNSVLAQGYNLVSIVAPVGLTLRTAGFDDDLTKSFGAANADIVWVQNPDLSFSKYYIHSTSGWRDAITNTDLPALSDPVLSPSVFIQRKPVGTANLDLNVPAGYSDF